MGLLERLAQEIGIVARGPTGRLRTEYNADEVNRLIAAAHAAGRAEGLEAGAGVADARATKWSSAHQQIIEELNDRAGARMVGAYYAEAAEIAAAIRALK